MTTIGKFIQKLLGVIIFLLILASIGIFVYAKVADNSEIDDKIVSFLAGISPYSAQNAEDPSMGTEVGTESGISSNDVTTELFLPQKEVEVKVSDDSRAQTWTEEEKQALKKAYNTVLHKMGLATDNVYFYEMKNLDGNTYYSFQVVDDFGNAYEHILLYDPDTYNVYWHDEKGNLDYAYSTDSIYNGVVPGNTDVSYEDKTWQPVLEGYMDAILKSRDADKATTYVDSSCYYLAALSELNRDSYVDATVKNQDFLINEGIDLEERKKARTIDNYKWSYKIYNTEESIDEYNLDWIEAHIVIDLDVTSDDDDDFYRNYYCVHLREYSYGWRVAAFTKE